MLIPCAPAQELLESERARISGDEKLLSAQTRLRAAEQTNMALQDDLSKQRVLDSRHTHELSVRLQGSEAELRELSDQLQEREVELSELSEQLQDRTAQLHELNKQLGDREDLLQVDLSSSFPSLTFLNSMPLKLNWLEQ